jgi:hypothetical protein
MNLSSCANSSNIAAAAQRLLEGRSFSYDMKAGAQRLPLAVFFPRAFHLRLRQTRQGTDSFVPQMPENQSGLKTPRKNLGF